jgi:polysaccharide deacetylase family protein (PEP-CTERM system associated)
MNDASCEFRNLLSFDVEEYFQVEAAAVEQARWREYASRLEPCIDAILGMLNTAHVKATFFILAWVAQRKHPMIRRLVDEGHEVASHGYSHQMLNRLDPERFRSELEDSRKILEDIAGTAVIGFRAPTFSITHRTAWALDVLAEAGYRYDSSVFPIRHDRYGVRQAPPTHHHAVAPSGRTILEIPPLTLSVGCFRLPIGGGGYLRLWPVRVVGMAISKSQKSGTPAMLYLHPWELDACQPPLPMSRLSRWRHRVNLGRTASKLEWLLARYSFGDVRSSLQPLLATTQMYLYGASAKLDASLRKR